NVIDAAKGFCAVAALDPGYKDAQQNCNIMKDQAAREEKKNEERFNDCVKAFNSGDLDTAEQKCKNVRGGAHVAEAQTYLTSKIPAARSAAAGAANANAGAAAFDAGVQAFNSNDFGTAKSKLGSVTGPKQGDAQTYLTKIRQYE